MIEITKSLYGITLGEFLLRVFLACIVGISFGLERRNRGKPAGMKTNMLVCAGSCVVAIVQIMISTRTGLEHKGDGVGSDTTRFIAPVISGLGFLGAGVIMRGSNKVKGLTTAATLWLVAILGIGIGSGFYEFIIPTSIMILVLSYLIKHVELVFIERRKVKKIVLEYEQSEELDLLLEQLIEEKDIKILMEKKISEIDIKKKVIIKKMVYFSIPRYVSSKSLYNIIRRFKEVKGITKIH